MCQFSGYSREELLSMNPLDLLDSESRQIFQQRINEGLAGEKITENVEFRVLINMGVNYGLVLTLSPLIQMEN